MYCIWAAIVGKFAFADEEWDCWLVSAGTAAVRTEVAGVGLRATRDVYEPCGRHSILAISLGSGASRTLLRVLRFRGPIQVRLLREACLTQARDVSAVCTIKEAKWKPIRHSHGGGILEMRDRSGRRKASLSRD